MARNDHAVEHRSTYKEAGEAAREIAAQYDISPTIQWSDQHQQFAVYVDKGTCDCLEREREELDDDPSLIVDDETLLEEERARDIAEAEQMINYDLERDEIHQEKTDYQDDFSRADDDGWPYED